MRRLVAFSRALHQKTRTLRSECSKSVNGKTGGLRKDGKGGDDNEMICHFIDIADFRFRKRMKVTGRDKKMRNETEKNLALMVRAVTVVTLFTVATRTADVIAQPLVVQT